MFCVIVVHSLAQGQQYDEDGIVDIFRQYGDHLYRYVLQSSACLHLQLSLTDKTNIQPFSAFYVIFEVLMVSLCLV